MSFDQEYQPLLVIDPTDRELFTLFKKSADNNMAEEYFPQLYDMLQTKKKLIRFTHNHVIGKVFVDFPDRQPYNKLFNTSEQEIIDINASINGTETGN